MASSKNSESSDTRTLDVREFASLVATTRRGGRPGLSMVAVNLRPLEVSLEMQIVRDALIERIYRWSQDAEARFYNVDTRALFIVPKQGETTLLRASSEVRTAVGYLVGPRQQAIDMDLQDLVQIFHTVRDIRALSDFLTAYVRVPKIFDTPIARGEPLQDQHLADLRQRIEHGGPQTFIREFGRNQPLAKLNEEAVPEAVGAERFIAVQHLRGMLLPDVTFEHGGIDFDKLGRELDWAVLSAIRQEGASAFGHLTVNLTVDTFISDAFAEYAREFAEQTQDLELWAEVPIEQTLAKLGPFRRRQRELRAYRVFTMADHVRPSMLERMQMTDLDFEGFKFPLARDDMTLEGMRASLDELHERNAATVVTRIDHGEQLDAAFGLGVRHVQGYLVDRLLAKLDDER
jgi:hypothetical protein